MIQNVIIKVTNLTLACLTQPEAPYPSPIGRHITQQLIQIPFLNWVLDYILRISQIWQIRDRNDKTSIFQ